MNFGNNSDVKPKDPVVIAWEREIESARKREKAYRDNASKVVKIYEADEKVDYQFNILYSNTETMLPALYNSTPRPDVQPRYKDTAKLPATASQVAKRTLEFLLDTDQAEYSRFDDAMTAAVLSALVPGRGVTRFKYDAEIVQAPAAADGGIGQDASSVSESVSHETVCAEEVPWNRVYFGYAQKWKDLPWLAFEHFMSREELIQNFGKELGQRIPTPIKGGQHSEGSEQKEVKAADGEKLAQVFEIWDKAKREVLFIAGDYGDVIRRVKDPLRLKHFFPVVRPLMFFSRLSSLLPQTLYSFYEEQATELNTCTRRINMLMKALKVRGFYDATLEGLDELMKSEDNTLKPAENVSAMLQGQTLEKAIWFFPIEKLVAVLQQLYLQRQQIKDVIYEVTGISDIVRGSGAASETATQSNIKNQWGTIRLKRAQKEVQRYVKDCLRIMTELAFNHLGAETLAKMTGLQLPTRAQQVQAQQLLTQIQQMSATGAPSPVQPEKLQEIQGILNSPSWEDVLAVLSDDVQRDYRIDIEANSTIDADAQEDKQDVSEFMNAMGQFLSGTVPLIEQGVMPFPVMKSILLAITQRFRFGREVEDSIREMAAPQPQTDGGEAAKAQAQQAQAQADMQRIQAEAKASQEEVDGKLRLLQAELAAKQQELDLKARELQMRQTELERKAQQSAQEHAQKMELMVLQHSQAMAAARQPKGKKDADV